MRTMARPAPLVIGATTEKSTGMQATLVATVSPQKPSLLPLRFDVE
jgi:hypothetical protein